MTEQFSYMTAGDKDAPTMVFLHGWPDDASMWRHQVDVFKGDYYCVCPTLPNYGDTPSESGGMDFTELVERLHRTIESLASGPVILVTHDWGAFIGYLYEAAHPERVQTLIALDIGGHVQPSTIKEGAIFVSYQWMLILLWLIGGVIPPLGTAMTRAFARMLKVPERQASTLRSRCNYPYFYYWRALVVPSRRRELLKPYRPQCKVLFLYGAQKPLMFHSERWLKMVEEGGGRHASIANGAHWFMESDIDETNTHMKSWLAEQESKDAA